MKRATDLVLGVLGLLLLSPLLIAAGIAVAVGSGRPVLYRHRRVGRDGELFDVLKFRTMRASSEGSQITIGGDNRITSVGRFLRQYKIDELPQLLNVIRGEMSIVGPRPEAPKYVEAFANEFDAILKVRPGLTDPSSIKYRNEEELLADQDDPETFYVDHLLPQKLALSLEYVQNSSVRSDAQVIVSTIKSIAR